MIVACTSSSVYWSENGESITKYLFWLWEANEKEREKQEERASVVE